MPATFSLDAARRESNGRSCDLPLGSPIMPGAAADDRDRRVAEPLQPRQPHHRQQRSDVQARRRRIEADVRRHRFLGEQIGEPFGGVGHHAAPGEFVVEIGHDKTCVRCEAGRYYISRWRSFDELGSSRAWSRDDHRRAVLQTFAATAASAVTGFGAYGYLYERHELSVTRADVAVTGLPPALAGLRIGFLTDVHRSLWVSHDDVRAGGGAADGRTSRSHRPRRRLRHLGRPASTSSSRRKRSPAVGAARRLRRSSAITTTTTTCRRRWPRTASRC